MPAFKLDENFSPALAELLAGRGHDAESVLAEKLSGIPDADLYQVCIAENRCLITLDLDFADIIRFPADTTAGIIVVRPHQPITFDVMKRMIELLVKALETTSPESSLWILEPHQLRMRKPKG